MRQEPFKCNYYSKRNDDSTKRSSNRIRNMEVKVTGIERDKEGHVMLLLKRIG